MGLLLALALAALLAPAAQASASWTPPSVLLKGDEAALLNTVALPDGRLRLAIADSKRGIELGFLDGRPFGDPLVVLREPASVGRVAFAADGSGVAVGSSTVIAFDAAGATAAAGAITDIGDDVGLAVSPAGAAAVAWVAESPQGYEVLARTRDPGTAAFSAPVRAGYATTKHTLVSVGIGDRGEAVVAWQTNLFPSDVAAAVRLPGAGFSKARFIDRQAGYAQLAVGPGGQAILAVDRGAGLDMSVKPPGADTLPRARRIDRGRGYALGVAAAGPNRVAAAWIAAPRVSRNARVRIYDGTRRVGTVGRDAIGENVELAIDPAGAAVVAWEEAIKRKSRLAVASRAAGARFGAHRYVSPVTTSTVTPVSVQLAPGGHAWVLYDAYKLYLTERTP